MKWRAYPAYRDSGVEWLGEIPEQWQTRRIGHTTYVKGRIGWQGLTSGEFVDEGPYCVTGTDLVDGKVNWDTCYHVTEERYREDPYIHLKERDLLITKDGTIGKTAIVVDLSAKATLNSGIFLTRPTKQAYDTTFMYWILNSRVFNDFIDITKMGSTIAHLYQNVFVRFSFPLPSPDEQWAISSFLDRETSRIDELITKKQRQIELLQEKRSALISHVVTKGLDPDVKMKDSGVEWLGEMPEHWAVDRLRRLSKRVTDGAHISPDQSSEDYPFVSIVDVKNGAIDFENCLRTSAASYEYFVRNDCRPFENDVLFSKDGTVGQTALVDFDRDFVVSSSLVIISPIPTRIHPGFLEYWLNGSLLQQDIALQMSGAALRRISVEKISRFPVVVPLLSEQESIVAFLDRETSRIDELTEKANRSIDLLREYRTALISAAVTGKIDVSQEVA